jgi:hypothetical protein
MSSDNYLPEAADTAVEPLAVSVESFRKLLGIGHTAAWALIKHRKVETFKIGRRRLVIFASIRELVRPNTTIQP